MRRAWLPVCSVRIVTDSSTRLNLLGDPIEESPGRNLGLARVGELLTLDRVHPNPVLPAHAGYLMPLGAERRHEPAYGVFLPAGRLDNLINAGEGAGR